MALADDGGRVTTSQVDTHSVEEGNNGGDTENFDTRDSFTVDVGNLAEEDEDDEKGDAARAVAIEKNCVGVELNENLPMPLPRFISGSLINQQVGAHAVTPSSESTASQTNEDDGDDDNDSNDVGTRVVASAYLVRDTVEQQERIQALERTIRDFQERENAVAYADVVTRQGKIHESRNRQGRIHEARKFVELCCTGIGIPAKRKLAQFCCAAFAAFVVATAVAFALTNAANRPGTPQLHEWEQIGSDLVGEAPGDAFGGSVSLSANGTRLVVGAWLNAGVMGDESGHVRVFGWSSGLGDWVQMGSDIDGEDSGDQSGRSVAMSADGNRIAIGARANSGNGNQAGHVRVFDWDNVLGGWLQTGDDIDGENLGDESGGTVAISADGNRVAVGSDENGGAGYNSGHVRVFDWDEFTANWTQVGTDIDGTTPQERFGFDVYLSADGNRLAVTAFRKNNENGENAGEGRVFRFDDSLESWIQLGASISGDVAGGRMEPVAMSANGYRVAFGSPFSYGRTGHVRVFDWDEDEDNWSQVGSSITGENQEELFGGSLCMSGDGNRIVVGASGKNSDSSIAAGNAQVYDYDEESMDWVQVGRALTGTNYSDNFGGAVFICDEGHRVVAGGFDLDGSNQYSTGYVRVYEFRAVS